MTNVTNYRNSPLRFPDKIWRLFGAELRELSGCTPSLLTLILWAVHRGRLCMISITLLLSSSWRRNKNLSKIQWTIQIQCKVNYADVTSLQLMCHMENNANSVWTHTYSYAHCIWMKYYKNTWELVLVVYPVSHHSYSVPLVLSVMSCQISLCRSASPLSVRATALNHIWAGSLNPTESVWKNAISEYAEL